MFLVSPQAYLHTVLFIFVTAAALPRFFVLARILVAGGASALVLDLVLVAGVVDLEQNAQPPLCVACISSNSKFGLETAPWSK